MWHYSLCDCFQNMPCYFGQKGHNKQTWQFRKTHPQLRVLQKEAKARMNFFDQIQEALEKHQSAEGTLLPSTSQEQQKTATTTSPEQLITLQPRTKTAKDTFMHNYSKTQTEDIYPSQEEILSVTDYMKAVWLGRIQKGHNHQQIEDLAKLPHANQTKVIVLTYDTRKKPEQHEQHKST